MISHRLIALTFVILHSSFDIASAAPPPPELTVLRQQYEKVFAERVTAAHEAAVGDLNTKFTAALDNAIAQAKSAGDLPTVLAMQSDQKLLAEKQPLPAEDAEGTPEALKKLRTIYRAQLAKLTEQRTANTTALLAPYTVKLQQLEAVLTKNDRVEEAKTVMDYRMALAADAPMPAPVVAAAPGAPAPPAAADLPKGDDRKAAEWVLSLGGKVSLTGSKDAITKTEELPKGRFEITGITLPDQVGKIEDLEFDRLANLASLHYLNCYRSGNSDAALRFIGTCPSLDEINIQNWNNATGQWLQYLAPLKNLKELTCVSAAKSDVSGLAHLPEGLQALVLRDSPANDESLRHLSRLKNLRRLMLRKSNVTDAGLAQLAPLTKLEVLQLTETTLSAGSMRPLAHLKLTHLGFGRTAADTGSAAAELATLFPRLESLEFGIGTATAATLIQVAKAWPKLKRIDFPSNVEFETDTFTTLSTLLPDLDQLFFYQTKLTDAHLADLSRCKKLRDLNIVACSGISDAAIPYLEAMKNLKVIQFKGTGLTEAGIAAFKKQRPDVRVVK